MKVLIIQQKMIGDVLATSILFEAIKEKHADYELHYLLNSHTYPVVENNPYIDKFVFFTPEHEKNTLKLIGLAKQIRKEKYDAVIDVYAKLSSQIITLFSGAKTRISTYKSFVSLYYNHLVKSEWKANEGERAIKSRLNLLKPIGISSEVIRPKIYLKEEEIQNAKEFLSSNGLNLETPIIMISLFGSSDNKTYPNEYMVKVLDFIVSKTKSQILFNYIPNQKNQALSVYKKTKKNTQAHIFLDIYAKNLRDFIALTSQCNTLIGNEGGAVNMAKAINIPTFTFFSPWIRKTSWNTATDNKTHIAVHLKDYKPEIYEANNLKTIKSKVEHFYNLFEFDYFKDQLEVYLDHIIE
ncbi:MAG: glycosyltransferase family 9 protein [Winogradskyella sp.]|uniref:glycosyltransferase family 9 protein n=1 Tax=Winogradskyella sp. TaxID=1883156 RepID=UPI0025D647C7|nr:glycosyltransferase family 9 protein [Winogradskyella sp.]NRB58549.1 glycosyltransferase family 9 protein [Winogradskyella sp.]